MKWCWSRLPGGVVTWEGYELFRVGERGTTSLQASWLHPETDDARLGLCP